METFDVLKQIKQQKEQLAWEGTFQEYFAMVVRSPRLARLAHTRIYDTILSAGVEPGPQGTPVYRLFSQDLFGIDRTIEQVVEYFQAGARGFDTRKRILLLMGPPASGKSTLVNLIKDGLERYSRTPEGALYAIKGCPMQEEPLHLIPPEFRAEIRETYGLEIEGDLCPHCRWMLDQTYRGDVERMRVRRVVLSEQMGIGIGMFVAADPGSEDISRLIGSVDQALQSPERLETFGKAYRLNGELNVANRGLAEFIEIFKLDERFLTILLVLSEEQKIKAPGFGTLYADEAIVAHTNETEYNAMISNPNTEGLQDRMVVIHVPYNLRVSNEVQVYEKMLHHVDLKGVHLSPLCLPVAGTFAVLSRLEPSEKHRLSVLQKMRLYNGEFVDQKQIQDLEEIQAETPREGMFGISPRFVTNQISRAAIAGGRSCLDPLDLLKTLWEGIEQSTSLSHAEQQRLYSLFQDTRRAYDEMALREVQKAFVPDFQRLAEGMIQEYLQGVEKWLASSANGSHKKESLDPASLSVMRNMETAIQVPDYDAAAFRRQMHAAALGSTPGDHPDGMGGMPGSLEEAAVRRLCPGPRSVEDVITQVAFRDPLAKKRAEVKERLINEHGYQDECAEHLLEYTAGLHISSGRFLRSRGTKNLRWLHEG